MTNTTHMTPLDKLQGKLQIEIMDFNSNHTHYDLEIGTRQTADGYDVYVMTNSSYENNFDWENDVYYYQPSFDDIMSRIMELEPGDKVYVDDIEEYFPDYEIEDWINDNEDLDEDY